MLQTVSFIGLESGPKLLILGAVHGNEKCGTYAIRRVLKEFEEGTLAIQKGSITFVPICNPRAFDEDVRYVERNLNRYLLPQENPDCYEAQIGNVLCPLLEKCDVLLDLHSYTAGGAPFVFVGNPGTKEHEFANCLGASAGFPIGAVALTTCKTGVPKTKKRAFQKTRISPKKSYPELYFGARKELNLHGFQISITAMAKNPFALPG